MKRLLKKKLASSQVKSFIQNIHPLETPQLKMIKHQLKSNDFDEAQRAWTEKQASNFMRRNKGILNFDKSDQSFL
jgi:hypothetical protein